jgi:HAMP domain-containing protein
MKLMTKFNLILLVIFGTGGILIAQAAYTFLMNNARREVLQQAEVLMASAEAARDYMSETLEPLLDQVPVRNGEFRAEIVPQVSAIAMFTQLQKRRPEYGYKAAALNPRNLDHRASCWEVDLITWLVNHPEQKQFEGEHEAAGVRSLYLAKPVRMDPSCEVCHTDPKMAPAAMVTRYGPTNGFGWKPDDIVAAEIVSVPMSVPLAIANKAFRHLLVSLIATMILTIIALDAGVYWLVVRPLKVVSEAANRVSTGEKDVPRLRVRGSDEIATVTAAFNRMQVSLVKALKLLE